jgi:hypothetical protein
MSTSYQTLTGEYHLILKIRGTDRAIDLFHRFMRRCDSDWPWKEHGSGSRVCESCTGIVYHNPRLNPEDIKIGAKQVSTLGFGDVKVKITRYTLDSTCHKSATIPHAPTMWVPQSVAFDMYTSGGKERTREAIATANRTNRPIAPVVPAVVIQ